MEIQNASGKHDGIHNICKFNLNQTSDLTCANFIYEHTDCQATPQRADMNMVYLVVKGRGRLSCEQSDYDISAGDLFFVRKGEQRAIISIDPLAYFYISFGGRRSEEYLERMGVCSENRVFKDQTTLIPMWEHCLEAAFPYNIDLFSEAVLLYSFAYLRPAERSQNSVILRVIKLVEENYTDPDFSLAYVASTIGYHSKYISTLFKQHQGVSFTAYLRELRIRHAVFLMEQGVASVKSVALLSGFHDPLYFSKLFTKEMGLVPKAYIHQISSRDV